MLVITRRKGQAVWIGGALVRVIANSSGQVRLGIEAPRETKVLRDELKTTKGKTNGDEDEGDNGAEHAAA